MVFYRVLELAVAHDPVRYQDLIAEPGTPSSELPLENFGAQLVRLNGYPQPV